MYLQHNATSENTTSVWALCVSTRFLYGLAAPRERRSSHVRCIIHVILLCVRATKFLHGETIQARRANPLMCVRGEIIRLYACACGLWPVPAHTLVVRRQYLYIRIHIHIYIYTYTHVTVHVL